MQNTTHSRVSRQKCIAPKFLTMPGAKSVAQIFLTVGFCLMLSGCFNGAGSIDLGSVSIGQQLIDLKKARDSKSLSQQEYEQAKQAILSLLDNITDYNDDDDNDDRDRRDHDTDDDDDDDDDKDDGDEDSGFLF